MQHDKREFFRVNTALPVRARLVRPEERDQIEGEIRLMRSPDVSGIDPALASWLDNIESKLDAALEALIPAGQEWVTEPGLHEIQISGGGLRLPVVRSVPEGALLLVELTLGGTPRRRIRATAKVVHEEGPSQSEDGGLHAAAAFDTINEEDCDAVVRFALEVQRKGLRRRSGTSQSVA